MKRDARYFRSATPSRFSHSRETPHIPFLCWRRSLAGRLKSRRRNFTLQHNRRTARYRREKRGTPHRDNLCFRVNIRALHLLQLTKTLRAEHCTVHAQSVNTVHVSTHAEVVLATLTVQPVLLMPRLHCREVVQQLGVVRWSDLSPRLARRFAAGAHANDVSDLVYRSAVLNVLHRRLT
jgi:hypothetical protein